MLMGQTLLHDGKLMPLTGAGHQVYIMEGWERPTSGPGPNQVFEAVMQTALSQWSGTWLERSDLLCGQVVYDAWQDAIRDATGSNRNSLHQHHPQCIRAMTAARRAFATWLRTVAGGLHADNVPRAATWAAGCDRLTELLGPYESSEFVLEQMKDGGRTALCGPLEAARQIEAETYDRLRA